LASAFQRKIWCSDSLEEFDRALGDQPEFAVDHDLQRRVIACLGGRTQGRALRLIAERLTPAAEAALREAAEADPNGEIRRGAARALAQMGR
jgi:hypothetical protein